MSVGRGGRVALAPHWFWNFHLKMVVFLVLRVVKIKFHHFWHPLEKFRKNRRVASPGKNPSVAHARSVSNVFCHLYLKFPYFFVEPIWKIRIFNDRIKEILENADLHLKTNKIVLKILSYKRSPWIKQRETTKMKFCNIGISNIHMHYCCKFYNVI